MANVRRARSKDREDLPLHFEGVELQPSIRLGAWVAGLAGAVGGVTVMVLEAGSAVEIVGALAAAVGAMLLFGVIRCRRFETTVGKRWLKLMCGPLKQDVALQLIEGAVIREASSWRRLYSADEVALTIVGSPGPVLPSLDGGELISLLTDEDLRRER